MSKKTWMVVFVLFSIASTVANPSFASPPPLAPPPTDTPTPLPTPTITVIPTPTPVPTFTPLPSPTTGPLCSSTIEGLVLDAETGVPLPGIVVELKGNGWKTQTATGSDGLFRFYGLCYGVGEISLSGMTIVEGDPKVFLDGKSIVKIVLKARSIKPAPVQTPTPTKTYSLPKTGNAWWAVVTGLALGILAVTINRLRHLVRRSNL